MASGMGGRMCLAGRSLKSARRLVIPPRRWTSSATSCSTPLDATASNLPPILWTYMPSHVPYAVGLALQEALVRYRINSKNAAEFEPSSSSVHPPTTPDVLLLLQHTPVYTSGRREKDPEVLEKERRRLQEVAKGADYEMTMRGGQTTYHGPGQLTGYPILDLGPMAMSTRHYVDRLLSFLATLLQHPSLAFPIPTLPACTPDLPVGTFLTPTTKIGSIGVQVRRRITSHGFAINVEREVEEWFRKIVACGLTDVQMVSIQGVIEEKEGAKAKIEKVTVDGIVPAAVEVFGKIMGRKMELLGSGAGQDEQVLELVDLANRGEARSLASFASSTELPR